MSSAISPFAYECEIIIKEVIDEDACVCLCEHVTMTVDDSGNDCCYFLFLV